MTRFRQTRAGYAFGAREVVMRSIPGQPGKHELACGTCGGRAPWRALCDAGNVGGWLETHETCAAPAKKRAP